MDQLPVEITTMILECLQPHMRMKVRATCRLFNDIICGIKTPIKLIFCDEENSVIEYIIWKYNINKFTGRDNVLKICIYRKDLNTAVESFIRSLNPTKYWVEVICRVGFMLYHNFLKELIPEMNQIKWNKTGVKDWKYNLGWKLTPKLGNMIYQYNWRGKYIRGLVISSCCYYYSHMI